MNFSMEFFKYIEVCIDIQREVCSFMNEVDIKSNMADKEGTIARFKIHQS